MIKTLSLLFTLSLFLVSNIHAQTRGEYQTFQLLETLSGPAIDSQVVDATGFPGTFLGVEFGVDVYRVVYYTRGFNPDSIELATGLVGIPNNYPCPELSLLTFGHGLAVKDWDVPSANNNGYALITKGIASNGFIVASPDYLHLGVGASPGFQGFQHVDTEAAATIDLVRAVRLFCSTNNILLNGQVFLTGYSQGGHSSMATAMVMQEEHPFEFDVTGVFSGGGTFDMSGIAADSLASATRVTPERHSLPMVARSFVEIYKDSLPKYGFSSDPATAFDSIFESPYDIGLEVGLKRDTTYFPNFLDSIPSRMITDSLEVLFRNDPDFFFRKFLSYNDLYNWVPQMPVRLFQSEDDIEDPIENTYFTLAQFNQNGAPDVTLETVTGVSHPDAAIPWILSTKNHIHEMRNDCFTGVATAPTSAVISVYPNPTSSVLYINPNSKAYTNGQLSVYNAEGKLVLAQSIAEQSTIKINLSNQAPGYYLVGLTDAKGLNKVYKLVAIVK